MTGLLRRFLALLLMMSGLFCAYAATAEPSWQNNAGGGVSLREPDKQYPGVLELKAEALPDALTTGQDTMPRNDPTPQPESVEYKDITDTALDAIPTGPLTHPLADTQGTPVGIVPDAEPAAGLLSQPDLSQRDAQEKPFSWLSKIWPYLTGLALLTAGLLVYLLFCKPLFRKNWILNAEFSNSFPQDSRQFVQIPLAAWKRKPLTLLELWNCGVFLPLTGIDLSIYQKVRLIPVRRGISLAGIHEYGMVVCGNEKNTGRNGTTKSARKPVKFLVNQKQTIRIGDESSGQILSLELVAR